MAKVLSFSFSIIPSKEIPGLIFRMDWLDFLVVQGTLTIGRWMDEKAMVFPIVIYGCEIWTIKTAKETQMYRTVFWTLWERERVG